jgi:NADH-quinone oxidoreductase subunit G
VPRNDQLLIVSLHHIFGSDELSSLSPGIAERSPNPYIALNEQTIKDFGKAEGESLNIMIDDQQYSLPIVISNSLPKGIAGLPVSLRTMAYCDLPSWGTIKN